MSSHVNVEIKARSHRIEQIRDYLKENATEIKGVDHQIDTYFETRSGRLKLREGNIENSLIYYDRPDTEGPKQSDINLVRLTSDSGMRELLRKTNQIKVVVDKSREIYFIGNVKFHIDEVLHLGSFVEIEAIDSEGSIGLEKLSEQCRKYIDLFEIKASDFINCSYSDLILRKGGEFRKGLGREFEQFANMLTSLLELKDLNLDCGTMDHVCYRVETKEQYEKKKEYLSCVADLLVESEVGGRSIATYKLHKPLAFGEIKVDVLELPEPKPNRHYPTGFEHAEFVIEESFDDFANKHPSLEFDWGGTKKDFNPELRLRLGEGLSIKLHHQTLERVIEAEKG